MVVKEVQIRCSAIDCEYYCEPISSGDSSCTLDALDISSKGECHDYVPEET